MGRAIFLIALLTHILEHIFELALDLFVHLGRDADAARFRDRFQSGGNINAAAVDVRALANEVAKVDADPNDNLSASGRSRIRKSPIPP